MNLARITAVECMEKWTKIQQSNYKAGCSTINLARLNLLSVVDVRIIQEIVEALSHLTSRYMLPTSDELKYSSKLFYHYVHNKQTFRNITEYDSYMGARASRYSNGASSTVLI